MMSHRNLLAQLLPPVSYDATERFVKSELEAEGKQLDLVQFKSNSVLKAIVPFDAGELIVDWERVLALKPAVDTPYQARIKNILLKLAETGGLSIPYFINLLGKKLGYEIVINELTPFYANINRAGDVVYEHDAIFIWQVVVNGQSSGFSLMRFSAGNSVAGERLLVFSDPVIEQVFNDLKPAHTFVYFAYQEA